MERLLGHEQVREPVPAVLPRSDGEESRSRLLELISCPPFSRGSESRGALRVAVIHRYRQDSLRRTPRLPAKLAWFVAASGLGWVLAGATATYAEIETRKTKAEIPRALPGAPPLPDPLRARLAHRLSEAGPNYVPRTRHVDVQGAPLYSNRLLLESSPYLQQHAHNPVDWYPGATRPSKPQRVSVGPC